MEVLPLRTSKAFRLLLAAAGALALLTLGSQVVADWHSPADPDYPYWPSSALTPGSIQETRPSQFCQSGWAAAHRNVTSAQYRQVYAAYGIPYPQPTGTFELDHLIPLELGGANSNDNLWPEPRDTDWGWGFHQKDYLENYLHQLVCGGQLDAGTATFSVATDWFQTYCTYIGC
jgi:hypothetical protein